MQIRNALFVTAGIVGAAVGGAAISAALTDPTIDVGAVQATEIVGTPAAAVETSAAGSDENAPAVGLIPAQTVEGLEQLIGTLRAGEDPDDWYVSGVEVDFGPDGWISAAPSFGDFDGDGSSEPLLSELRGLEGLTVTLGVRYDRDGDRDDADAYTIQGLAFRDPAGGPAPWQTPVEGAEASRDVIAAAAVAAVGRGAVAIDVDRESDDGWFGWEVEVRATDGRRYEVYLDLAGTVVDIRPDNDRDDDRDDDRRDDRDDNSSAPAGSVVPAPAAGDEVSRDVIAAAAVAAVGSGAVAIDVDRESDDGWFGWEVEVRATDGRLYEVYLDLAGNVLEIEIYDNRDGNSYDDSYEGND